MTTKMTDDHDDDDDIVCVCFQACVCVVLQHWSPSALVPIGSGPTIGGPHHLLEIPSSAVGLFITSDPHHQQRSHHQQWSNHPIFLHANTHTDTHTRPHIIIIIIVVVVVVIIVRKTLANRRAALRPWKNCNLISYSIRECIQRICVNSW